MRKIGLISDTHNYLHETVFTHFAGCDEIWHAGDFGSMDVVHRLRSFKPLKAVYGNIDDHDIRSEFPLQLIFACEEVKVLMRHIGGYPNRYALGIKELLIKEKPQLFISGHSHILKIMFDEKFNCLHINPGAAGLQGWHKVPTLVRFVIDGSKISNCDVIELSKKKK